MPRVARANAYKRESVNPEELRKRETVMRFKYALSKGATDAQAFTVVARRMEMRVKDVIAIVESAK